MASSAPAGTISSSISNPCALCEKKGEVKGSIPPRFTEVQHFSLQAACIREFKCTLTGAKLFVCNLPSPVCNLYITFKTETHTDEGLPHTLEHLVFLGSKHYPYKGFLDLVASRCLSHGTNAWTATDHTTYTLTTAGSEGLLNLLPIYLDHLLLPTLTDDAFLTEVHHLKRDGSSSGVVYSEMEACERTASCILNNELLSRLYPGDSGYKYETGGRMEWIRRTNNRRVRAYHKAFYRWDNMAVIVTGCVAATDLLAVFAAAANKIDAAAAAATAGAAAAATDVTAESWEEFKKPLALGKEAWSDPINIQPLLSGERSVVRFPADDEKTGRVAVAWRGPPWSAFNEREALDIIGYYLSDTNLAILEKELVECRRPVCAAVEFGTESFKSTCLSIEAADVLLQQDPQQQKQQQHEEAGGDDGSNGSRGVGCSALRQEQERQGFAVAEKIVSLINKETLEGLDMNRIQSLLQRELLQYYYALETSPHNTLVDLVNEYFINGSSPSELAGYLDQGSLVSYLLSRPSSFWKELINKYILKAPSVTVCCLPSIHLAKTLQEGDLQETERVRKELGEKKLDEIQSKIDEIKQRQKDPPPSELLSTVPIAAVENVHFNTPNACTNFSLGAAATASAAAEETAAGAATVTATLRGDLVLTQLNSIPSEFVTLRLCVRTPQNWGLKEKQQLQLLLNVLFECDVMITKAEAQALKLDDDVIAAGIAAAAAAAAASPGADDNKTPVRIPHSCFTELLLKHVTAYNIGVGVDGSSGVGTVSSSLYDVVSLTLAAPIKNFMELCILLGAVIKGVCIEEHRVAVQLKRQKKQLIRKRRSAHYLVCQLERSLWFSRQCTLNACGWGSSSSSTAAATAAAAAAKRGEGETVSASLSRLYRQLFGPERMMLHLAADASKLPDGWQELLKEKTIIDGSSDFVHRAKNNHLNANPHSVLNIRLAAQDKILKQTASAQPLSKETTTTATTTATTTTTTTGSASVATKVVCGIGSSTASHAYLSIEGPEGFEHPDLPGLLVLCECCSMMEGLLFRSIRGAGYAYGCDLSYSPNIGQITLKLSPATDPVAAVQAALSCMEPFAKGESEFSAAEIDAAKCGVIYSIVREETAAEQSLQSLLAVLRGLPLDENKRLLRKVGLVDKTNVQAMAAKYLSKFIEAFGNGEKKETHTGTADTVEQQGVCSTLCLITNKDKVSAVVSGLNSIGIECLSLPSKCLFKFLQAEEDIPLSAALQADTEETESETETGSEEEEGSDDEGDSDDDEGDSDDDEGDSDDDRSMEEE